MIQSPRLQNHKCGNRSRKMLAQAVPVAQGLSNNLVHFISNTGAAQ